jgi:mannitol-1-phosphate/altronate dehydrogenase
MTRAGFDGDQRLVVIGFGPIGAGLFVYEAFRTGAYAAPVVVDVQAPLVDALRRNDGRFALNVAEAGGVRTHEIGPVVALDPSSGEDRERIVAAISGADIAATCLPGTAFYERGDQASPARLLAEGLARRRREAPLVLYAAENAVNAAGALAAAVDAAGPLPGPARLDARDTVIGKMSGLQTDPAVIAGLGLAPLTPGYPSAMLVEAFDAIRVSSPTSSGATAAPGAPGFPTFRAVDDLEPFEFAKLYGHNATHALGAFLGVHLRLDVFADLARVDGAMRLLADAFERESGAALVRRFAGVDPLFTDDGYHAYAEDLLARMTNPYLHDGIERAARDPRRKLGWDDRLVGTMRVCLAGGVEAPRYALGTAAGLAVLEPGVLSGRVSVRTALPASWPADLSDPVEAERICGLVEDGLAVLRRIVESGRVSL